MSTNSNGKVKYRVRIGPDGKIIKEPLQEMDVEKQKSSAAKTEERVAHITAPAPKTVEKPVEKHVSKAVEKIIEPEQKPKMEPKPQLKEVTPAPTSAPALEPKPVETVQTEPLQKLHIEEDAERRLNIINLPKQTVAMCLNRLYRSGSRPVKVEDDLVAINSLPYGDDSTMLVVAKGYSIAMFVLNKRSATDRTSDLSIEGDYIKFSGKTIAFVSDVEKAM